jgi:hypothetical protein
MPISSFPNGFANGVSIRGIPLVVSNPGRVFWVSSSANADYGAGSNGNDGSFRAPWATLVYAISQCTAANGDVIIVRPGHTETISSSSAMTLSKSGVAIVGLGQGNQRPKFTTTRDDNQ